MRIVKLKMDFWRAFSVCFCLVSAISAASAQGPVFINSQAAAVQPTAAATAAKDESYVTQTVYGFLDFTTTIGNTIMVFSPQSAAPPVAPIEGNKKDIFSNTVIETRPEAIKNEVNIKPSKTQQQPSEKKKSSAEGKKPSTVVQVKSNEPAIASKVEVKSDGPSSKVNAIQAKSESANAPSIITKVEIVDASTSKPPMHSIISKIEVVGPSEIVKANPPVIASAVHIVTKEASSIVSSVVQVKSDEEAAVIIGNNIGDPEYDFLSRQPSEFVEETYKVVNLKPSSKFHLKPRASTEIAKNKASKRADLPHPTGLVTKLGGTVIKDGITTIHETSVIGTFISGKYAQVLQSTSHVHNPPKGKINPTPSLRILKTAAPALNKGNKLLRQQHLDPTPAGALNEDSSLSVEGVSSSIKSTRKPGAFRPRFKNKQKETTETGDEANAPEPTPQPQQQQPNYKKSHKSRTQSPSRNSKQGKSSQRSQKTGRNSRRKTTTTPSAHSEEPTTQPPAVPKRFAGRRTKPKASSLASPSENKSGFSRRGYKPKIQTSTVEQNAASTSLYKFKLNRSPGRWQYKTTPKPRVPIRKQTEEELAAANETAGTVSSSQQAVGPDSLQSPQNNEVVSPQSRSDDVDGLEGSESIASIVDDDGSTENKVDGPAFPLETIKVEISTPPDFKDVYYEIATIKSPYTFQIGSVKNTRYVTVTSTFEKNIEPTATSEPLTENILATSSNYAKDNNFLDSSIATLPPLYLASDMETPPLETITETFSTSQTMLKTHILPVVRNGNETSSSTLVQTYLITRLVTATKTLPPMEAYHFIPSKTLNEFNSHLDEAGSELHLELEFGDSNEQDEEGQAKKAASLAFPADLNLANIGSDFNLSEVDKSRLEGHLRLKKAHNLPLVPKPPVNEPIQPGLNPEQLQQLALLRLLNPAAAAAQGQVITTSKPVVKVETLYETHVLPVTQGQNTILSTISKVKGTITKTDYEFGTSTVAPVLPPIQPQLPQINPLFPPQPQFAVTTTPIVQSTMVTQTNSKVLKLTFGAKTAYTTVFSTIVVPTVLTTYMTASVPVAPTAAAFPGYFPAPFPAYPYVG